MTRISAEPVESTLAELLADRGALSRLPLAEPDPLPGTEALDMQNLEAHDPVSGLRVPVRRYAPRNRTSALPAVLYIHGGGWVIGSIDMVHFLVAPLAVKLNAIVISVGYRLAPEHPFPAAFDDCLAVLRWMAAESAELGIDPARIALSGVSAGGTLATGVALAARDHGGPAIRLLHMVTPSLDDQADTASMRRQWEPEYLSSRLARECWDAYLRDVAGNVPAVAAPARADDLAGLPPTFIAVAELDAVRDEALQFAFRLIQAGVPVELHHFPGVTHGLAGDVGPGLRQRITETVPAALREALFQT
ncbi:alpha/beta hydrolase [Protofrankia symbiont of Coriaria ruscifolia]|uniref:Alpha/beta hydrolase domain-containing protein n=1 Tax=Candidatus Protofrankia californiensis TaxID=1839754 RepID=A0A1C3NYP7_9ACTN|nr:alpha/beta hydrolase [Protofrankia symbiont of Coriaria ruscifolia]SBW22670.1 alpha/beta hydrolase domain-containing protein [Candidatus Protofrankia californiensis]